MTYKQTKNHSDNLKHEFCNSSIKIQLKTMTLGQIKDDLHQNQINYGVQGNKKMLIINSIQFK